MGNRLLRILHVVKGLGPGGAERLLCAAAAERDREQFDYEVAYVLPWKDHLVPQFSAAGINVHCVGTGGGRVWPMLNPLWVARLARLIRARRYDIIHCHSPLVAGVVRPLVETLGRDRPRLVSTEHNSWTTYAPPTRLLNRLTFRLDDACFAVSEEVRGSVPAKLRRKVEVVVHGIQLDDVRAVRDQRDAVRAEFGFGPDDVVVGTVANYRAQKAYPDLLAAARIALDAMPDLRFVAIGQGPLEAQVHAEHARLQLGDRFRLPGYRSDAVRVLSGCDIFVLASHYEGFPVALMEALALGLPVVATAVGGIPDGLADAREGFLVPPKQPKKLADTLVRLGRDRELQLAMGKAASQRADYYDIARAVRNIEAVYRRLSRDASATVPETDGA